MSLATTNGDFVVVGANTPVPQFYWKGKPLTQVLGLSARTDDGMSHVKLRVQNTTTFDADYAEMATVGIQIKKV